MSATAPAVFITVPKYVAISPSPLPKIKPVPAQLRVVTASACFSPTSSGYQSSASSCGASDDGAPKGKKRRLDHLTWEEKIQRKKLKNRVAAQTSRDRKKARMEEMEHEINELTQRTEILQNKCESLQAINDSLLEKNQKLDMEVEELRQQLTDIQKQQQMQHNKSLSKNKRHDEELKSSIDTCTGCESILNGSAVSNNTDPLQQGSTQMDSQSTQEQLKKSNTSAALWKIVALCLLYKTCSCSMMSSMPGSWKSSLKACSQISQQTWREVIERAMKLLPKLQADQSDCLDQWWGPQQSAWNPANIAQQFQKIAA